MRLQLVVVRFGGWDYARVPQYWLIPDRVVSKLGTAPVSVEHCRFGYRCGL